MCLQCSLLNMNGALCDTDLSFGATEAKVGACGEHASHYEKTNTHLTMQSGNGRSAPFPRGGECKSVLFFLRKHSH